MVLLISYSTVVNYYVWLLRLALDGEGKINIEILLLCGAAKRAGWCPVLLARTPWLWVLTERGSSRVTLCTLGALPLVKRILERGAINFPGLRTGKN